MLRSTTTAASRRLLAKAVASSAPPASRALPPSSSLAGRGWTATALPPRRAFSAGGAHSSFAEPGSHFGSDDAGDVGAVPSPFGGGGGVAVPPADRNAPLRNDVRTMGSLLGHIIQGHHGMETFEKIEELRALAKKWRELGAGRRPETADGADQVFQELAGICASLSNEEILIISRAFTHFLAIANSAEGHHRVRLLNQSIRGEALPDRYDSW
jgi:hypothetical protein